MESKYRIQNRNKYTKCTHEATEIYWSCNLGNSSYNCCHYSGKLKLEMSTILEEVLDHTLESNASSYKNCNEALISNMNIKNMQHKTILKFRKTMTWNSSFSLILWK